VYVCHYYQGIRGRVIAFKAADRQVPGPTAPPPCPRREPAERDVSGEARLLGNRPSPTGGLPAAICGPSRARRRPCRCRAAKAVVPRDVFRRPNPSRELSRTSGLPERPAAVFAGYWQRRDGRALHLKLDELLTRAANSSIMVSSRISDGRGLEEGTDLGGTPLQAAHVGGQAGLERRLVP
jgi:hypothetical protein